MAAAANLEKFTKFLPKIELHAHINGSISVATMEKLLKRKVVSVDCDLTNFKKTERRTLDDCFVMLKLIHTITTDAEAAYLITCDIIHEFAEDNVKYLELRSTPRDIEESGLTKRAYIESVLKAIKDCESEGVDCIVRLLLSIDRRKGTEEALKVVNLAAEYRDKSGGLIVGIDLSGDPKVGDARDYIPVLKEAQNQGLKLALHLAECFNLNDETTAILDLVPERIGHGTFLRPEDGGSQEIVDQMVKHHIPLELCLTSNIIAQTVKTFDIHHFKRWYEIGHPCIICTDDKGVFSTSLSQEYRIAAETFDLKEDNLWDLSLRSIDFIFEDDKIKNGLRRKFKEIRDLCCSSKK
ncbi:adenosine deaminase-like protein [Lineus longissimus]|uniref:adenosine deaminase-like protein n=1 Tax=Lineus longissimus TaxID=88925 RepID=UPI00315CF1D2